jgi:hypothetical protein
VLVVRMDRLPGDAAPTAPLGSAVRIVLGYAVFVALDTLITLAWAVLSFRSSLLLSRRSGPAIDFPVDGTAREG